MKLKLVLSLISMFFINGFLFSQYEITIDAYVLDSNTKQPIPYVNVGFVNEGIGTVSDQNGRIFLQYDEEKIGAKSILQLSSLGYKTIQLSSQELFKVFEKNNTISMEPSVYALETATVTAEKRNKKIIGNTYKPKGPMGYWKDAKALGAEIGTRIRISHKNTKLHQLKFHVLENSSDSLLVRLNVYGSKRKIPRKNILTSNIYHTISRKQGIETIDLSDYNILVDDDIMVSLELVKVFGKEIEFSIAASEEGRSYLRYVSQDEWDINRDTGIAFNMDISYPVEKTKLRKREMPSNIVLYWDTSFSAEQNDPTATIQLLQDYIKKIKNATITLVPFSDDIHDPQKFTIQKGKTNGLFTSLEGMIYNGASNFESLFKEETTPDQYIVVSDGHATFGKPNPIYDVPVFYINHTPNANDNLLQEAAIQSEGYYINLTKVSSDQAIACLLNQIEDNSIYQMDLTPEYVKGLVTSEGKPVQGCKVTVKGTLNQTFTDANGSFSINAYNNDVLAFDFFEMIPQEITLDNTKDIRIDLESNHTVLDEVVVDVEIENEAEKTVLDMYGNEVSKKRIGYAMYTLEEKDFFPSAIFLSDLIRGRFPGVQVLGPGDDAVYRIRNDITLNNDIPPLFVVDGLPYQEPPTYLFPAQIESISVVNGMSASARFGGSARGGAFIITTKLNRPNGNVAKPVDNLLVKGNEYTTSSFLLDVNHNRPAYLDELWNSQSYTEAKKVYYNLRKERALSIPFYSYSAAYFTKWDPIFSDQILSSIAEIGFDNPQALLVLAFKLEAKENYDQAELLYERILELAPNAAQSHLDLARIYVTNKKYKEAFEVYKKILKNEESEADFTEIRTQAISEIRRLLSLHRSELSYNDVPTELLSVKGVPVRLVFEWNDPQSEFELQFVSPKKKFSKWKHIFRENKEELTARVHTGVLSKEFIMDNSMPGEWLINIQSFGDTSDLNPVFLKYTVYTNYGLENETKKVQCVRLYNQKDRVTLDKIVL